MKVMLGDLHINGTLTVSGNVSCGASGPTSAMDGVTMDASRPYEQDGWISVSMKLMRGQQVYQTNPIQYHEDVERKVKLWLADNAQGKYVVLMSTVAFKEADDAMMFYMTFGGKPVQS